MLEDRYNSEFDLLVRSILENGQEEVPAHVWDGVQDGLEGIAHRKKAMIWWRRALAGTAVAAALAAGLFLSIRMHEEHSYDGDMIAVVPEVKTPDGIAMAEEEPKAMVHSDMAAFVPRSADAFEFVSAAADIPEEKSSDNAQEAVQETSVETANGNLSQSEERRYKENEEEYRIDDDWKETPENGDFKSREIRTSVVISGITGTNSTRNKTRYNLMRRPTVPATRPRTGITETSTNTAYGIPVSFGAGVRFDITDRWSIGAGMNYTLLTRKFYGTYTKATEEGEIEFSQSSDIRNSQHYVGIPLNAYFNIVNSRYINFYAYAGGTAEKCISDRYEVLNISGSPIIHKEKAKGIQLSANVGIGVEFMLGKHVGLYVDPSLRYYFDNGQPKSIRTAQPLMLGFEMGLRARL